MIKLLNTLTQKYRSEESKPDVIPLDICQYSQRCDQYNANTCSDLLSQSTCSVADGFSLEGITVRDDSFDHFGEVTVEDIKRIGLAVN